MNANIGRRQFMNVSLVGGTGLFIGGLGRISQGAETAQAGSLLVGAATTSITPDKPVPLDGHRGLRISNKVESPVTATALALESCNGDKTIDAAIIVSCDIVAIRQDIMEQVRSKVKPRLPDFDVNKLFLCATHTHNAPVTLEGRYTLPESGVMKPSEYSEFMTTRVADVVVESWQKRRVGKVGWAQGQAVVAQNRRATYADGTAKMYGATNIPEFRGMEGYEDHNLDVLFFWDQQNHLIATAVNIPCPSQDAEGGLSIHADFWHPVRQMLHDRYGKDLLVLGLAGAGGDQTSRPQYGKTADDRMRKLRGLTRLEEVARRIVNGWEDAFEIARKDIHNDIILRHCVKQIELPHRKVTEAEVAEAHKEAEKYAKIPAQRWNYRWHQAVVERYEAQKAGTEGPYKMELHVVRLGDVVITTNEFELFTDYGVQMKARSPAVQTFVIQLAAGSYGYLPTERAVRGGGYSAVIQSNRIGPEGGQVLVEETLKQIKELFQ
ncbi:MAG: hypothetical protein PHR77_13465 [Kiritimatiellae bacterium]|nr:hypothetical protein [Kiritimatiellia bacterium]MDD5519705.1 hypothetical protein [Kiritimatiellia bacterium]